MACDRFMEVCFQQLGTEPWWKSRRNGAGWMWSAHRRLPAHPHVGWQWDMAGCVTAVLSVQILYAKQGLRVRRHLTRDNVKEKAKEMRRILTKIRLVAKEVQCLLGNPCSELKRIGKKRILSWLLGLLPVWAEAFPLLSFLSM